MQSHRVQLIHQRLTNTFSPENLHIIDESHKHAGHAGAKEGGGHFHVKIVSTAFSGKKTLERHRMVYGALSELMTTEIHALGIQALTPDEV